MRESSAGQTGPVKYLATDRPDKPAGFRNTRTWIYFSFPGGIHCRGTDQQLFKS